MLKNILKLDGAQELTKVEQKSINGGITEICVKGISSGLAILKVTAVCPPEYPLPGGGCCFAE